MKKKLLLVMIIAAALWAPPAANADGPVPPEGEDCTLSWDWYCEEDPCEETLEAGGGSRAVAAWIEVPRCEEEDGCEIDPISCEGIKPDPCLIPKDVPDGAAIQSGCVPTTTPLPSPEVPAVTIPSPPAWNPSPPRRRPHCKKPKRKRRKHFAPCRHHR